MLKHRSVLFLSALLVGIAFMATPSLMGQEPAPKKKLTPAEEYKLKRPGGLKQFLDDGAEIGYIIIILSFVAVGFVVEHSITLRKSRLIPERVSKELETKIRQRKIDDAIKFCQDPENASFLTSLVLAGLERFKSSEYGAIEYRTAVEEAGAEESARMYRKTEVLAVIGAIAPMLGLLGTVQGMIEAFETIAASGGAATPADLASSIATALITTLDGLVVAIPTLTALSYFRSRIDALVAEAGKRIEHILTPLGRQR